MKIDWSEVTENGVFKDETMTEEFVKWVSKVSLSNFSGAVLEIKKLDLETSQVALMMMFKVYIETIT